MRHYSPNHALTDAWQQHEQRIAQHLIDAELRRALARPTLRARIAASLHSLADRLEPRTALRTAPARHTPCT